MNTKNIFLLLALLLSSFLNAQVAKDSELFLALKKHDSLFFEKSFNECDLAFLEKAIHPDLVFYHDQGGVQNKTTFLESVKNNICSNPNQKPIRKVKGDSLAVFPLYENGILYGVFQQGIHEFYLREQGKNDVLTSTARFTHVYLLINNQWILREVLSYDHQ
ncbi:nuclear transport factor 2 family protein [Flavobacterium piscinae]|uniref:Nuclear transport factor 2 family protein n=1 Tax=Flavobacterium piscinae TaxID=2506424 RepID=A0A4Q1KIX6_9FLAO|nr:nuclear transport factor 2 family protein [Flavobacterium piscinae]RXR29089.1 nuclear transport factor 2 family protein [Flavobacterium piscinae]